MQIADFFVIIDEILAYIKKNHYLCSRFGCKDVTHACVRMSKSQGNYKDMNMKTQELKQMPMNTEYSSSASQQRQYYTVDEAMAYLEPRIRAMFR